MRFVYDGEIDGLIEYEEEESFEEYLERKRAEEVTTANELSVLDKSIMELKKFSTVLRLHFSKHKAVYKIGAAIVIVFLASTTGVSAAGFEEAVMPGNEIDATVNMLYKQLLKVGKWAIIIKGAFDTISSTIQGDFVQARKSAVAYMIVYVILLGLPWAFTKIEDIFEGMI